MLLTDRVASSFIKVPINSSPFSPPRKPSLLSQVSIDIESLPVLDFSRAATLSAWLKVYSPSGSLIGLPSSTVHLSSAGILSLLPGDATTTTAFLPVAKSFASAVGTPAPTASAATSAAFSAAAAAFSSSLSIFPSLFPIGLTVPASISSRSFLFLAASVFSSSVTCSSSACFASSSFLFLLPLR
ncbi:hypothetical protein ES703_101595 [subsurface metagenome]